MGLFLKQLQRHFIDASRTDLSEKELLDLKLRKKGGYDVYEYIHSNIVRDKWKDWPGYPIKAKFHAKGLLACTISIRKISKVTGYSTRIVREVLDIMVELGHIVKNNKHTRNRQTVYIFGVWYVVKDKKGEDKYFENLYRDDVRDSYIKQKTNKKEKETVQEEYNFEELPREDYSKFFTKV